MKLIKNVIKRYLRKRGLKITTRNYYQEKLELAQYNWLKKQNILTIIDVGASDGGFAKKIRSIFPEAWIYSFEPLIESFEKLNKKFENDKRFSSFNIALTNNKGNILFYKNDHIGCSSLLEMRDLHKIAYPDSVNMEKIIVPCDTLDNIYDKLEINGHILLKIDVQGAEKIVLEGAEKLLSKVKIIFTEVNFNELYCGNVLFDDLSQYLFNKGFKIEGVENVSQSLVNGSFLQADVYFKRIN